MRIILASQSPRRRELLGELYSDFEIIPSDADEALDGGVEPSRAAELLAIRKGAAVAAREADALIISSDTLVALDGAILGKPRDEAEAARMLASLSGRGHLVHTGVAVHYRGRVYSGTDTTCVRFRTISDEEIKDYIKSGEPMDKAGAYGIQGEGGKFVEGYDGSFDTVVGLSLELTKKLIKAATEDE